jgi:hypothetical protein
MTERLVLIGVQINPVVSDRHGDLDHSRRRSVSDAVGEAAEHRLRVVDVPEDLIVRP